MLNLRQRHLLTFCLILCYFWLAITCNENEGKKDAADADGKQDMNTPQAQAEQTVEKTGIHTLSHPDKQNMKENQVNVIPSKSGLSQSKSNGKDNSEHGISKSMHVSQHNSPVSHSSLSDKFNNGVKNEGIADFKSKHINSDGAIIEEGQKGDELLFEESGSKDELLVEQMKRLSEKIKWAQDNTNDVKNIKNRENSVLHTYSESQVKNMKQKNRIALAHRSKQKQREHDEAVKPNEKNDKLNGFASEDTTHEDQIALTNARETVIDQLRKIEEKVKIGEIFVPVIEVNNDEHDFPVDETLENTEEANDKLKMEASSSSTIDNTMPPPSSVHPYKTHVLDTLPYKTDDKADKTLVMEMSTIDNLKPSSVHTFTQTKQSSKQTLEQIIVDSVKSTQGKQNKRIKKFKESLRQQQLFQAVQETAYAGNAGSVLKDDIIRDSSTSVQKTEILATEAIDDTQSVNVLKEIHDGKSFQYSGTAQNQVFQSVSIQHSSVLPSREMQKTEVKHHIARKLEMDISTQSEKDSKLPKSTEHQVSDKDMPKVKETVTDTAQESQEPKQLDTPQTEEESEPDKEKKQQAQRYFEVGEKLVNNSYKKDYIQAYEYFKLAADMGHIKALEYLGFGYLLGDYIKLDPDRALKIFKDLSDKGFPRGQLGLGLSYSAGLAVNSSQAKALIYFTFSALGGDPLAQMVLGYRYLSGIGVESKCETALQYYRKVATTVAESTSSGSPVIQRVRLYDQAENKENGASLMDADLLQYYEFLADKGDVQAQVVLGQLYYQGGRGVSINHERAHHYFSMAAESGNSNSQAFLGRMHSEGSPVISQDHNLAFKYFKRAAEKGNPIGQCGLGVSYLYGKGVEKDYSKALRSFTQSADQGWSDGQLHLGIMHFSGKGIKRDYKMAVKFFNLASQGGHVLAFYHLAQMHATGTGVLRNCHTAVELYKNVAERGSWASMLMETHQLYKEGNVNEALLKYSFLAELGYEVAQTNVAYILDQGESSLFDQEETYQRALLHWTRAASQGSTIARLKMGDYHYYGYGTDIDYESAATHYRLATEQQHNAQAMFNLGYMHENGLGLKQDVHLAKRFYDMAAETSVDAYVPVSLALIKLGLFYGADVFNKELEGYYTILNRLDPRYQLGPNWDIFLSTFLAIVLGIIIILRRQR